MSDVAEPTTTATGRVRKFDRPPPPKDWRWWVGGVGKTLIAAGLLMFGFVAYQLWGTAIETARAQSSLESEFEELLAVTSAPVTSDPETPAPDTSDPATSDPATSDPATSDPATSETGEPPVALAIEEGDPIARIEMPTIGVDNIVVAGVEKGDLKKGPGHYPDTPMPGQLGNAAIAGHRTTYGQPFFDVDKLGVGDEIVVTTLEGRFVYRVTGQQIVQPSDYQVVATTDPTRATLTLTSCHPKWTARERIIIFSELDPAASTSEAGEPVINYGRPLDGPSNATADEAEIDPTNTVVATGSVPGTDSATGTGTVTGSGTGTDPDAASEAVGGGDPTAPAAGASGAAATGISDAFSDGWFSDPGANSQVLLWGLALAAVGIVSYLISRTARRDWVGLTVGIVPFFVVLYFFFQNVNRLLPPAL